MQSIEPMSMGSPTSPNSQLRFKNNQSPYLPFFLLGESLTQSPQQNRMGMGGRTGIYGSSPPNYQIPSQQSGFYGGKNVGVVSAVQQQQHLLQQQNQHQSLMQQQQLQQKQQQIKYGGFCNSGSSKQQLYPDKYDSPFSNRDGKQHQGMGMGGVGGGGGATKSKGPPTVGLMETLNDQSPLPNRNRRFLLEDSLNYGNFNSPMTQQQLNRSNSRWNLGQNNGDISISSALESNNNNNPENSFFSAEGDRFLFSAAEDGDPNDLWVTVFGFQSKMVSYVLMEFVQLGTIMKQSIPADGNWVEVQYKTRVQAKRALSKHGKILVGNTMIGVIPGRVKSNSSQSSSSPQQSGHIFPDDQSSSKDDSALPDYDKRRWAIVNHHRLLNGSTNKINGSTYNINEGSTNKIINSCFPSPPTTTTANTITPTATIAAAAAREREAQLSNDTSFFNRTEATTTTTIGPDRFFPDRCGSGKDNFLAGNVGEGSYNFLAGSGGGSHGAAVRESDGLLSKAVNFVQGFF